MKRLQDIQDGHSQLHDLVYDELTQMHMMREATRCLYCYDAPCITACPTHIDIPSFIRKIATNNVIGSAQVIMSANPLGASCARVCPTDDLCEGACVLGKEDSPIEIGNLQRYATDELRLHDHVELFHASPSTGHRVAIIGGGPAGLSAARELAVLGHEVTIYDAHDLLGGLCTYGIVPFRLPLDVAMWEVEQVLRLGVKTCLHTRVGEDIDVKEILAQYSAVVLAFGLGKVPMLGIQGEELEGVYDAIDMIEQVKMGQWKQTIGPRVAIIGAGNTAIDAATCARRLGAKQVTIYYRKTENEMTAYPFEYEFAKQEGIEFRWQCVPNRLMGDDGHVSHMELLHTQIHVDEGGKIKAVSQEGTDWIEPVDQVIRAIGQEKITELIKLFDVETHENVVKVNENYCTNRKNIYAIGDLIFAKGLKGEAMVVEAAWQGKKAAQGIDHYLRYVVQEQPYSMGGENHG